MSTRRTAVLAAIFVLLAVYFFSFEREPAETARAEKTETILPCAGRGIEELRVSGPRGVASAVRSGGSDGRWTATVDPARRDRAAGAFEDLADALCRLPVIDRIAGRAGLAEYGLEKPKIEIRARIGGATRVLAIGDATPVGNLMYARRADERQVLKVGVQLASEIDKVAAYASP